MNNKFIISEEERRRIKSLYEQTSPASTKFQSTKDGITDFVVVNTPNKDAKTLYDKTLNWVSETSRNPDQVLKSKIPNEKIIIEGTKQLTGGPNFIKFRVIFSFKDGKYKMEVPEIFISGSAIGNYDYKQNLSQYFKGDGTPKSQRLASSVLEIDETLNLLNSGLEKYLNTDSSAKDNW